MNKALSNTEQVQGIRRYTLENGLKVIELYNESMHVLLNESKCLDIMQVFYKGVNVSYISKNGFNNNNHLPFEERYEGGTLYTSGLEMVGSMEGYPTHGTVHTRPMNIEKSYIEGNRLIVVGTNRNSAIFSKNLVLKRTIVLEGNSIHLTDELSNESYKDENYALLYHINMGYPLLDDGAKIEGDFKSVKPRTKFAEENIKTHKLITKPFDNQDEMVYYIDNNSNYASLINEKINMKYTITYSKDTLPNLVEWKCMQSGEYALGLEPTTTYFDKDFKYKTIKPNEVVTFSVSITINNL